MTTIRQLLLLLLLLVTIPSARAVIGENAIMGKPQIDCTEDAITFTVHTAMPFRGSIYIRGHHGVDNCRQLFYTNPDNQASFSVRIGDCGMSRNRQLQPFGINYILDFVTTFDPQFVTKLDRTFHVRCFYAQADKMVNAEMNVNSLPTESLEQVTTVLPSCRYSLREGAVDGPRVRDITIGSVMVHRWECDNPHYGMLVRNCYVNDGSGTSIQILDNMGCPVSLQIATSPLIYDKSLNLAYMTVEAFNFPDRTMQQFQCQISVCSKVDNDCLGKTPPNCPRFPRSEYRPNSIIEPGTNPTQVVATFQGAVRSNSIGETLIDGKLTPTDITDNYIPNVRGMEPAILHPWRREQDEISTESSEQPTRSYEPTTTRPEFTTSVPLEIFKRSTHSAEAVVNATEDNRHPRLADQVMDVESDAIYVRQADDPSWTSEALLSTRSQNCTINSMLIILTTITVPLLVFAIIVIFVCFYKSGKVYQEYADSCSSEARTSISGLCDQQTGHPIYSRPLGQPTYVMPISHFRP